jgi:hypothetical protein
VLGRDDIQSEVLEEDGQEAESRADVGAAPSSQVGQHGGYDVESRSAGVEGLKDSRDICVRGFLREREGGKFLADRFKHRFDRLIDHRITNRIEWIEWHA